MKKTPHNLFSGLALIFLMASCQKDPDKNNKPGAVENPESMTEMVVPSNFSYSTSRGISYDFSIDKAPLAGTYRVDVYDFTPSAGGGLMESSFITKGGSISGTLDFGTAQENVYVKLTAPDGSSTLQKLALQGNSLNHTFYDRGKREKKSSVTSPNCNTGCDQSQSLSKHLNVNRGNDVYCISGPYNGSGINVNGGAGSNTAIRLCGTGTINNINLNKGTLEITAGADVTINNLGINSSSDGVIIYPGGTLTVASNQFGLNSDVTNYGTLNVTNLNVNSNITLTNNGTINVSDDADFNNGMSINNDAISVSGEATINSNSTVENNCSFTISEGLTINGDLTNYAYVSTGQELHINGGGKLEMHDGAMTSAQSVHLNGTIDGIGTTSLIKVAGNSKSNSGAAVSGNIEYCDANGIESFASNTFSGNAMAACNVYIPTSSCNTEGNGSPQIADADGDGVADNADEYPNDPNRAANDYYPSSNQMATLGFEDLWPGYGDYDFNDLVVDYRYQFVLNANNQVVALKPQIATRAIGGAYHNGFGFQLDLNSSAIQNVSGTQYTTNLITLNGNGTEAGQSKATIIAFDDAYDVLQPQAGAFVNTVQGNPYSTPDTLNLTVALNSPQAKTNLGTTPFNPFIFIKGERGREVHLSGNQPTDKANTNLFKTGQDDTDPNGSKQYKSTDNLPWAINVVGGFSYPAEKQDIVQAYNYFDEWAQSGGATNGDWYKDLSGYINNSKVYQEP